MSDEQKPREFWIDVDYENLVSGEMEGRAISEPIIGKDECIHVIEKSAYDIMKQSAIEIEQDRDTAWQLCENCELREAKLKTERDTLRAELAQVREELEAVKTGKGITNPYLVKDRLIKDLETKLAVAKRVLQNITLTKSVMPEFDWEFEARQALSEIDGGKDWIIL